jgi:hypothetical protein
MRWAPERYAGASSSLIRFPPVEGEAGGHASTEGPQTLEHVHAIRISGPANIVAAGDHDFERVAFFQAETLDNGRRQANREGSVPSLDPGDVRLVVHPRIVRPRASPVKRSDGASEACKALDC